MITQFWQEKEAENPSDPVPFNIHEQDRLAIRNTVVEAIIQAPDPIRYSFNVGGKLIQVSILEYEICSGSVVDKECLT